MRETKLQQPSFIWTSPPQKLNRKAVPGSVTISDDATGKMNVLIGCPHQVGVCAECAQIAIRSLTETALSLSERLHHHRKQAQRLARIARRRRT